MLNKHKSYAWRSIKYNASMIEKGLIGILDVDTKADIWVTADKLEKVRI